MSVINQQSQNTDEYLKVASCTAEELFNTSRQVVPDSNIEGIITIPEYQRPYSWGLKEVEKLINDLDEYFNNEYAVKPMYYLGSIILHQEKGDLKIIDGQQRITTLALIQDVLKSTTPINNDSFISKDNKQKTLKFLRSEKNIKKIQNIDLSQINITLIITDIEDDAYTFFETQNTGGVRLTGVDIIKAHHLRAITTKGGQQDCYAGIWENQHAVETVIEYLIKARRWGVLNWKDVPSDRDKKGTKLSIIEEFSENTLDADEKKGYQQITLSDNYTKLALQSFHLAIRQPLANGENYIDYLKVFCELYQRLFIKSDDKEIQDEYYTFNKEIIKIIDGTAFLKELYEIALMCYANRFGLKNLLEASYWIFRKSYSRRVSNEKTVRENTIPAFIKECYLFDHILYSFNHEDLIKKLKSFRYTIKTENIEGDTVKSRFIQRVASYFKFTSGWDKKKDFDNQLIEKIHAKYDSKKV